jgi:hypothetical protein
MQRGSLVSVVTIVVLVAVVWCVASVLVALALAAVFHAIIPPVRLASAVPDELAHGNDAALARDVEYAGDEATAARARRGLRVVAGSR